MKNIILFMLVLWGLTAKAQKPAIISGDEKGWYNIGKVSASFKSERESIIVMGKDEFNIIKLRVEDAPIDIERMQVFFEGGKVQEIEVKQPLKEGEETRGFRLDADNTEIDKVVFYYHTLGNEDGERAAVELYGYKEHPDRESAGLREETEDERDQINEEARDAREDVDKAADQTGEDIRQGANNLRDEVDEQATKLESEITDRELEDKVGPDGQEIYVDDNSNYYYVDESGNKIMISPSEFKAREK